MTLDLEDQLRLVFARLADETPLDTHPKFGERAVTTGAATSASSRRFVIVAIAAAVILIVGFAAIIAKREPTTVNPASTALPLDGVTPGSVILGLFPHGGRDGALTAGYHTPTDVVAAYLAEITDPSRLPDGFAVTATVAETAPVRATDADHAWVAVSLQTVGDSGDAQIGVQRVSTNPDVWQVTKAVVIADELTDVSLSAGVINGSIAPAAGGTTTLYAYDLATGDTLDTTTLTTPSLYDQPQKSPTPFSLNVGVRDSVGLRYWNTVAPAGAYAFANFADQAFISTEAIAEEVAPVSPPRSTALPAPQPTSTTIAATVADAATLLVPGDGQVADYTGSAVTGPPGSSAVVLIAPDGSMFVMRMTPNTLGPVAHSDTPPQRTFGTTNVRFESQTAVGQYGIYSDCWSLSITDGGGIEPNSAWRPTVTELLESSDTDAVGASFVLPTGWQIVTQTGTGRVYEVQLRAPSATGDQFVTVLQSTGTGVAVHAGMAARDLRRMTFLDGEAWVGVASIDPIATTIIWEQGATNFLVQAQITDRAQIEQIVAGMATIPVADWPERFGPLGEPDEQVQLGSGCDIPVLTAKTGTT